MITKERLEELKYKTIYTTLGGVSGIYLDDETLLKDDKLYEKDRKYGYLFVGNLKHLYETKEEAEFVQKFHTSKTIYFEPLTWEEFLKTETKNIFANWSSGEIEIILHKKRCFSINEITVHLHNSWQKFKSFKYTKNNIKQKYYEAVEYAKNLFLGE